MICSFCNRDKGNVLICPYCHNQSPHCLPVGTIIAGRYLIQSAADKDDWCISYYARDKRFDTTVSIAEYYPRLCCARSLKPSSGSYACVSCFPLERGTNIAQCPPRSDYQRDSRVSVVSEQQKFISGKNRFHDLAKRQKSYRLFNSLTYVLDYCEENNTAYLITEKVYSTDQSEYLRQLSLICSGITQPVDPEKSSSSAASYSTSSAGTTGPESSFTAVPPSTGSSAASASATPSFEDVISGRHKPPVDQSRKTPHETPPEALPKTPPKAPPTPPAQSEDVVIDNTADKKPVMVEYGSFVNLLCWLVLIGTLVFDYFFIFKRRDYWLAFTTENKIILIGAVLLCNALMVLLLRITYKPHPVNKGKGAVAGLVALTIILTASLPHIIQMGQPTGVLPSKVIVTETDDTAQTFQKTVDYLYDNADLKGFRKHSYEGSSYTVEDSKYSSSMIYRTGLENPNYMDRVLSKSVTISGNEYTLGKTTVQDMLDDGWEIDGNALEANSDSLQFTGLKKRNSSYSFSIVVANTGSDPNKATIEQLQCTDSLFGYFNYKGISSSGDLKEVTKKLGPPKYYYIYTSKTTNTIELRYQSKASDVDIIIDFEFNAKSNKCSFSGFYIS